MIGETVSRYLILDVLGEGGMGTVYRAEDTLLKRKVAIKFLTRDLGDGSFREEARLLGEIDDPYVCRLYEYVECADGAAIPHPFTRSGSVCAASPGTFELR